MGVAKSLGIMFFFCVWGGGVCGEFCEVWPNLGPTSSVTHKALKMLPKPPCLTIIVMIFHYYHCYCFLSLGEVTESRVQEEGSEFWGQGVRGLSV